MMRDDERERLLKRMAAPSPRETPRMAHAHENTLIAKLGFSDPDRTNPLHGMACQYLTQREVASKFLHLNPEAELKYWLEYHLTKGDRFPMTVGFVDVRIAVLGTPDLINVEVKAHPITAGDVLRQISLYQTYTNGRWMLATCYPIKNREAIELKNASIQHVQLSPDRVQAWAAEQDQVPYEALEV